MHTDSHCLADIVPGDLTQQLGHRWQHPLVWAVIPALLFGAAHYNGQLPDYGGLRYVLVTFLMGLTFAVMVWRAGNIWSAVGLHVGNNLMGLHLIGTEGLLGGTQIWLFERTAATGVFDASLVMAAVMFLIVLSPIGRVFGDGRRVETIR